jgi:hypothetical protein
MKTNKILSIVLLTALLVGACKQTPIDPVPPPGPPDQPTPTAGSANFTKFVAVGNSFVAGVQGGALFNDGQANSLAAILNKQFALAGGTATFNQPNINATLGWNLFVTQPLLPPGLPPDLTKPVLGRLLLQYGANTPSCATGLISPTPQAQSYAVGNFEAVPNPMLNPAFIYGNGSTKPTLNNFAIPAITLGQTLTPATGNWGNPDPAIGFSPFYARLEYPGAGTATILGTTPGAGDVAAAGGTFFLLWLGLDDFFLYAAFGGDPTLAPLTSSAAFAGQYALAVGNLLASDASLNGVIGNFPNIFVMPHFTSVSYKPIPLDAATATLVSTGFAGYNAALDGLVANAGAFGISAALVTEIGTRKVNFSEKCDNNILIADETLADLGPYFDALQGAGGITAPQRAALAPYEQVRQTTSGDIVPLSAGSILGTLVGGDPTLVNGVTVPLADRYVLIPSEITAINSARDAFNATVATTAAANPTRLALADVDAAFSSLVTSKFAIYNGVTITPNINPPSGIYSEDGVHPNSRGYAWMSHSFITAINSKFAATIPLTDISLYSATGLPIP